MNEVAYRDRIGALFRQTEFRTGDVPEFEWKDRETSARLRFERNEELGPHPRCLSVSSLHPPLILFHLQYMLYHHHHYFPTLVGSLNTFPIAIVLPSSRSVNLPSCGLSAKLSMHTLPPTTLILTWQMNERTNERTNE